MSDKAHSGRVVIAGAGCAGLAAGIALQKKGFKVTIIEKLNRVGGLAGGIEIAGNTYEYGPHIFHTTDPEVMEDVKRIAGKHLIHFEKTIQIKFLGNYFAFPLTLKDILSKLPKLTVIQAGLSFCKYFLIGAIEGKKALINSEKVLQRLYGDVLYRIFFKDYIAKVWGIEPVAMAPSFANQRIPKLDLLELINKIKIMIFGHQKKEVSTKDYVEKVEGENYTTKKGFSLIVESFANEFKANGGVLQFNTELRSVKVQNSRCVGVEVKSATEVETLACDHFISTIPISEFPALIQPTCSKEILDAAALLKFRGVLFVGVLVNKAEVLPASFMYFRDKSFNRITDLGKFSVEVKPPGATLLVAEITCQPTDEIWKNQELAIKTVLQELYEENLLTPADVLEAHTFHAEHGYPIYTVGYEKNLDTVLTGLSQYENIHSIGRQGQFAYVNTHIAMKMGYEVARKIG